MTLKRKYNYFLMRNKKLDYQFTATPFNLIMLVAVLMYFADTKKQQNYLKILIYYWLKNVLIYVQQNVNSSDPKKMKLMHKKHIMHIHFTFPWFHLFNGERNSYKTKSFHCWLKLRVYFWYFELISANINGVWNARKLGETYKTFEFILT